MKIERLRAFMSRDKDRPRVIVAIDSGDGLTGWGVEMDTALLGTEDYVNWQRKVPVKPDGSTGYV